MWKPFLKVNPPITATALMIYTIFIIMKGNTHYKCKNALQLEIQYKSMETSLLHNTSIDLYSTSCNNANLAFITYSRILVLHVIHRTI